MYNYGYSSGVSSPALTHVTFSGNQAANGSGGGMYNDGNSGVSSPALTHVTFSGNQAIVGSGGGMYNFGPNGVSSPALTHVTFSGNQTSSDGGGMFNYGEGGVSSPALTHVTFSGNEAGISGGGMFNDGYDSGVSSPALTNVIFSGNRANFGGGMYNDGRNGGVSSPALTYVTFSGNQADECGGGMYNRSESGAGSPALTNVILWGNAAAKAGNQVYNYSATPVLSFTLIQSGTNDIYNNNSTVAYGPGILTTDPQFVAPITATAAPTTTGNYRLQANSPAIDAADPAACPADDLNGNPRNDLRCDIGAYERQFSDGDTVIKTGFTGGVPYSFGPTWVSMTLSLDDAGTITATKHITYPGGVYDDGEMQATWYISSTLGAGLPVTLSFCYTDDEVTGLAEDTLEMFRWSGTQWVDMNATPDPDNNCVTLAGVSAFSAWTLKDTGQGATTPTAVALRGLGARGGLALLAGAVLAVGAVVSRRRKRRCAVGNRNSQFQRG